MPSMSMVGGGDDGAASDRAPPGIENFRDFGGGRTRDGGRVRRGLLFRSAHHHHATAADGAALAAAGITHIFDLRSAIERRAQPSAAFEALGAAIIDGGDADEGGAAAPDASLGGGYDMAGQYRGFAFAAGHLAVFARYFQALADPGTGAVLIHCAAGKDRTGLLAALTLRLLDVDDDDIVADYLLTNAGRDIEALVPRLRARLARSGASIGEDAARAMLRADASWLAAADAAIEAACGSVRAYLRDRVGVDDAMCAAIRLRLVARQRSSWNS